MQAKTPKETTSQLLDQIQKQPIDAQLGLVRTVLPLLLQNLEGDRRLGFMRELLREMESAMPGGSPYDGRPDAPSHEPL